MIVPFTIALLMLLVPLLVCSLLFPYYKRWGDEIGRRKTSSQTRTGSVPRILARLNSTALGLMDHIDVRHVARQGRFFDAHLEQALDLVLTGQCSAFSHWKTLVAQPGL